MIADTYTAGDRYAHAVSSSDLSLMSGRRTDADHLLAAGYAARRNRRGMVALCIYRMRATQDVTSFDAAVEHAADWLVGRGVRAGGKAKVSRTEARATAQSTLLWWVRGVCQPCEGRRYTQIPGTPHLTATLCPSCRGTGTEPIERAVSARHLESAQWLAAEFDVLCSRIMADMARLLSDRMTL
jgi:hypothetical protein